MSYQTNKEMRTVTISIPQALVQKIDSIAIDEERSRSKMIEILLKKILYKNSPNLMKSNKDSKSEKYDGFRKELISHYIH